MTVCADCNGPQSEGAIRCGDCQAIWDGPDGPQPGDTCCECSQPFGPTGPRTVPIGMDVWEHDVPILGAVAGEPITYCLVLCQRCAVAPALPTTEERPV